MPFFRRPVRSRPIRVFLIGMVAVPLVSLLALYGFAASITVSNAISDHEYNVSAAAMPIRNTLMGRERPGRRKNAIAPHTR